MKNFAKSEFSKGQEKNAISNPIDSHIHLNYNFLKNDFRSSRRPIWMETSGFRRPNLSMLCRVRRTLCAPSTSGYNPPQMHNYLLSGVRIGNKN